MKQKRLLCAGLALVLLFSAQPAALAVASRTTVIDANRVRLPVIRLTIPTRGSVYINPLKLPVSIGDAESEDQIVSAPACIANQSEVPVEVDITVTGTIKTGSNMKLVTTPTGGTGDAKNAFVYFEIHQSNSEDPEDVTWDSSYNASKHAVIIAGVPRSYPSTLTLPGITPNGEVASGGYAPFRLTGDAVKTPTIPWTTKDGINVIVSFTCRPLPYPTS